MVVFLVTLSNEPYPLGVFSTRKLAENYIRDEKFDGDIWEFQLDIAERRT